MDYRRPATCVLPWQLDYSYLPNVLTLHTASINDAYGIKYRANYIRSDLCLYLPSWIPLENAWILCLIKSFSGVFTIPVSFFMSGFCSFMFKSGSLIKCGYVLLHIPPLPHLHSTFSFLPMSLSLLSLSGIVGVVYGTSLDVRTLQMK